VTPCAVSIPRSSDDVGAVPNRPNVSLVLVVTATIGGVLLVIGSLSRADALCILVWTLFSAGMAARAWSRH